MQVTVNGNVVNIPSDLSQITLKQFIEWYDEYGRSLDEKLSAILASEYKDEILREFDLEEHIINEALAWFSFFSGFDFADIKGTENAELIIDRYKIIRYLLKENENDFEEFPREIEWNNEVWAIQDFKVDPKSKMDFNEIITSKEAMRQLYKLGKSRWESLLYLSIIFFRKKGEAYTDELMHEDSERMKLMENLPMSIAMQVGFFLKNCVDTWQKISAYSGEGEADQISPN
ncbi:MAG: hypothetical protein IPQ08_15450 [Chitinophagaceae bacterium]|nr:hypothetical protein [Chitinophagaceae bacterium]